MLYKGILSKLNAAKELMAEFVEREKKKQIERDADKAARAAKVGFFTSFLGCAAAPGLRGCFVPVALNATSDMFCTYVELVAQVKLYFV
jgi:hypothetical protein